MFKLVKKLGVAGPPPGSGSVRLSKTGLAAVRVEDLARVGIVDLAVVLVDESAGLLAIRRPKGDEAQDASRVDHRSVSLRSIDVHRGCKALGVKLAKIAERYPLTIKGNMIVLSLVDGTRTKD